VTGPRELSWLALVPRDTIFIRDGRSFDAAADTTARSVLPHPSTIAGAVGAAYGAKPKAARGTVPDEVLGPVLARRLGTDWHAYFPVPADLVAEDDTVLRLRPASALGSTDLGSAGTGSTGTGSAPERWLVPPAGAGKVKPVSGWLPGAVLADYLSGRLGGSGRMPKADLRLEDPLRPEQRIGLARTPDRIARPEYLYQAIHLRPADGWAFLAGCALPAGWHRAAAGPVRFGGRGRLADVQAAADVTWPARPEAFPGGRVLAYLATPALWPDGWRIPLPPEATLAAAAAGEPIPVGTTTADASWRANRMLRWAAPAGSVYLLRFGDETSAAKWAARTHGTAYGLADDDPRRTAGFGVVLTGVWE